MNHKLYPGRLEAGISQNAIQHVTYLEHSLLSVAQRKQTNQIGVEHQLCQICMENQLRQSYVNEALRNRLI